MVSNLSSQKKVSIDFQYRGYSHKAVVEKSYSDHWRFGIRQHLLFWSKQIKIINKTNITQWEKHFD